MNYFQPSFKLLVETREGTRVVKHYISPATARDRLLQSNSVGAEVNEDMGRPRHRNGPG